jgi:hypothetical protein
MWYVDCGECCGPAAALSPKRNSLENMGRRCFYAPENARWMALDPYLPKNEGKNISISHKLEFRALRNLDTIDYLGFRIWLSCRATRNIPEDHPLVLLFDFQMERPLRSLMGGIACVYEFTSLRSFGLLAAMKRGSPSSTHSRTKLLLERLVIFWAAHRISHTSSEGRNA